MSPFLVTRQFSDYTFKAVVEKILKVLTVENKDIRKAEWNNKEVSSSPNFGYLNRVSLSPLLI
jgi:hypothetical protein